MALLVLLGCGGPLPEGDATRPDIVLVSIDSLRADHLGAYGYARDTSPFLDDLAAGGLRFANARAASPWTLPSHMTMLTGLPATRHQVVEDDLAIAPGVPLVQEALQSAGWATAGFVSTIYVSKAFGFGRGFDLFRDYDISEKANLQHAAPAPRVLGDALAWMKERKGEPAFLFLHLYDVHYPYAPAEPFDAKFDPPATAKELRYKNYRFYQRNPLSKTRLRGLEAQYDECIAWVDDELRKFHEAWKKSDRPVVFVVVSDHGEELGERGSWGHAHTLYGEQLHVPLIVNGPGIAASVREELVGTVDLAPTIAAIAGIGPWTGPGVDLRQPVPARPWVADTARFDTARLSVEDAGWRLDLDLKRRARALYDLSKDPGETHDLERADPARADAMERVLAAQLGEDWVLDAGEVATDGFLWQGGARVGQKLATPGRFALYPSDATVTPLGGAATQGLSGAPSTGPLRYEGPRNAGPITLSDETRAQLEALGYLQGDDEKAGDEKADQDEGGGHEGGGDEGAP